MSLDDTARPDATHYAFKPSFVGAPSEFQLFENDLEWRNPSRSLRIAYRDISHVRLVFRPVTLHNYRFVAELRSRTGIKLTVASASWRSMVEYERHDAQYTAFIAELHRRIAASGATPVYRAGAPAFLYWPGLLIFSGLMIATTILAFRAVGIGEWQGAIFVALMLCLFLWQSIPFFRRNWPAAYAADNLPARALP